MAESKTPWKNSAAGTVRSPSGPAIDELRAEREDHGREVGRRVAVGERAADRAAMAHLRIADQAGGVRDDRAVLLDQRVVRIALYRVSAPIASHSPASRTYESSSRRPMSTSSDGRAKRSLSSGISEWPPASSFASSREPSS